MSGRPSAGSNRIAIGSSESYPHHDRFYPIRSPTINPGISRNTGGAHHLAPGMLSGYREAMTIRAVTPEAEDTEGNDTDDSLAPQHSPSTTPPRTPSRSGNRLGGGMEYPMGSSPEVSEPSSPRRRRGQQSGAPLSELNLRNQSTAIPIERSQSVTPVPEAKLQETPPSSMPSKKPPAGHPSSVGFPSATPTTPTTSPAATKPPQSKANKRFLRPQSSINTLHRHASSDPPISPVQSTDVSRVLRLMKELRGRMEGILEFRVADNLHWTRGYCLINEDTGSLVHQREEGISSSPIVVIPDLRGCQVKAPAMMEEADGIIEVLTHSSKIDVKLRPINPQQYDYWLAALLCWQPIRPAGAQNKMVKPHQPTIGMEKRGIDRRRNSDASTLKEPAIIKVGRMLLWRKGGVHSIQGPSGGGRNGHRGGHKSVTWERISCTLQENGEFRLFTEVDTNLLTVIQLSQLNRCAVQILDPSILDQDFCIAIYPQYTPSTSAYSLARPVYLAVEPRTDARMIFEVWYVLLRAFTMPELYGPAVASVSSSATSSTVRIPEHGTEVSFQEATVPVNPLCDSYRIQRSLFLRIIEAKITGLGKSGGKDANADYELSSSIGSHHSHLSDYKEKKMDCYAEVVLDGEARAKTMVRTKTANPFWREDYEFPDLPAVLSDVAVILKQRDPRWKKNGGGTSGGPGSVTGSGGFGGGLGGTSIPGGRDTILGRVDIQLDELKVDNETEAWWPLMNLAKGTEDKIGEMFLKIGLEELIVLMADEYKGLSELLYNFSNGLTHQLALIMTSDLRRLAMTLLKIYQVAGKASEWLMALAEEEIDGPYKEATVQRLLGEPTVPDSLDEQIRREAIARMDANILFRGNSLLTKALDAHMRRLGREYLDETLGAHLKRIADDDIYCEVDPIRVDRQEDLNRNWKTLLNITRAIWQAIYSSPQRCPIELRRILKHIRTCVEDRYGDILRTVSYSSVSGFLFLRFFCPAVLNPKLFGLLKDHPGTRAQRTLTLIAKSLQGLANMTTFGVKEPWMEPMNEFLAEHTDEFKDFIDSVSNFSMKNITPVVPPAYVTPTTILSRLSQSSREGFPSLPYLIDQPRAFASLVMMWDKWYPVYRDKNPNHPLVSMGGDITKFHTICLGIRDRMRECVEKAENAERPNSSLSTRWEEVAEKVAGPVMIHQNHQMWSAPAPGPSGAGSSGDSKGQKYGSTKGHKILGVNTGGGVNSIMDYQYQVGGSDAMSSTSLISSGGSLSTTGGGGGGGGVSGDGVGMHYLSKKTLSELVVGLRKKVNKNGEREKDKGERDREKEEKREKKEQRDRERAQNKGEWRFDTDYDIEKPEKPEKNRRS